MTPKIADFWAECRDFYALMPESVRFFVTRISQITQILLADGERLPQAENLRNLCNLCDPQSTYYNSLHSIADKREVPIFAEKLASDEPSEEKYPSNRALV